MRTRFALALVVAPLAAWAEQPLSAIEWLNRPPPTGLPGTVLMEPPVTQTGVQPGIEVSPLDQRPQPIGLVSGEVTGLPTDLWRGSDPTRLAQLIAQVPVADSPAMQKLLYTLLLTEAGAPAAPGAEEMLTLARLDRLLQLGATDPAQSLAEVAGATARPGQFQRWFDATLLTGDEDRSCAALLNAPYLSDDYATQVFCQARLGDWQSAVLTLEAALALDLLAPAKLDLLDRFLSPDIFEDAPPLSAPTSPDPLEFRLHETIGERLPTASLPRRFATADLRDVAGWKAQIEAAERLTRIGALAPNHLLGLYSHRKPAASGGVWDRVRAVQKFDAALSDGDAARVAQTLPAAWSAMREARLEVPFATLFSDRLGALPAADADSATNKLIWEITALSGAGFDRLSPLPDDGDETRFLAALAHGDPLRAPAPNATAQALAAGFGQATLSRELQDMIDNGRLGEAILEAMTLFHDGASGNSADLTAATTLFLTVGLEQTARQSALQVMLLDRG